MRLFRAFVKVGLGMTAGAVLFFLVALACSATAGSPATAETAVAIEAGMMLAGGIVGEIVGFILWRRSGSPDDPPLF